MDLHIAGQAIEIADTCRYLTFVAVATVVIAGIMKFVRDIQSREGQWHDYVVPFLIGTLELAIYPVLISSGHLNAIGWWLGIKTAAGWRWRDQAEKGRRLYTNFLLGNALVIAASLLITMAI